MLRYAATVLPECGSKVWKSKMFVHQQVEDAARQVLGPSALALPFGSSVNGCGESTSDLDLVLYVPLEKKNSSKRKAASQNAGKRVLRKVLRECRRKGLVLDESRLQAKIPIVSLRDRHNLSSCDVSFDNLLPLYNSWLLRAYVELEPRLAVLAVVVKRFAKTLGVASTMFGYISSYSWTLMVVYYLQVCHGLPSLHEAAVDAQARGLEAPKRNHRRFATEFATKVERHHNLTVGMADLLRGFFAFYSDSFNWSSEVVSVWRGARGTTDELPLPLKKAKANVGVGAFHIQDPIQLERNLNFALNEKRLKHLKSVVVEANKALHAGEGLPECMMEGAVPTLPAAWLQDPDAMLRKRLGAFSAPYSRRIICECEKCGVRLELGEWLEHQGRCGFELSEARPFGCAQCSKAFVREEDLEQHQVATGHVGVECFEKG